MSYYTILTDLGLTRLAEAHASGVPVVFAEVAVGDGGGAEYEPVSTQTALVNEVWRGDVNAVDQDPANDTHVRVEAIIPADDGGFTIREVGIFNDAGELLAVAKHPPTYKATPAEGVTTQHYLRPVLAVTDADDVTLTVDTSIVTATREYVDDRVAGSLLHMHELFS